MRREQAMFVPTWQNPIPNRPMPASVAANRIRRVLYPDYTEHVLLGCMGAATVWVCAQIWFAWLIYAGDASPGITEGPGALPRFLLVTGLLALSITALVACVRADRRRRRLVRETLASVGLHPLPSERRAAIWYPPEPAPRRREGDGQAGVGFIR